MAAEALCRVVLALFLAAMMSRRGYKRGTLTKAGAIAAFFTGLLHLSCGWAFGAVLIAFYTTSTKLTRLCLAHKAALDASTTPGGGRGAAQVLCASCGGAFAAVLAVAAPLLLDKSRGRNVQLLSWCAFLGHYACSCGDTWASELGMLSARPPRLLTTLSLVPPGVHGAISPLGLVASAAGGSAMGLVQWIVSAASGEVYALDTPCLGGVACGTTLHVPLFWLALGLTCGLTGSLLDSLLGATCQWSGVCPVSGKVVSQPSNSARHLAGMALLTNQAVNAVSAALTSAAAAAGVWFILLK